MVFISYNNKDAALAYRIRETLESYQIPCWMAPEAIPPGGNYMAAIPSAIRQSNIFLLVLSNDSQLSTWVPKELSMALDAKKYVIPLHIDQSELKDDFNFGLHNVQRVEAYNRLPMALETVIARISGCMKEELDHASVGNQPVIAAAHMNENQHFTGREALLGAVRDALRQHGKIFLRGIGGIGKSELARQLIRRYRADFDLAVFLTFQGSLLSMVIDDSPDGLSISDTRRMQNEPEEAYFTRKLNRLKELTSQKTLIVVDNYDVDTDPHFRQLISGPYQMLFTTRNEQSCGLTVIDIPEMTPEEQMALFQHHYVLLLSEADKRNAAVLLQTVNGHTLTIELMAKLMRRMHCKPDKMLSEISAKGLQSAFSRTVDHESLVASAFSFVQYLFDTSALSEKELYVLVNMSLMPAGGVEFYRLMDLLDLEDGEVIDGLIRKSWLRHDLAEDKLFMHPLIAEVVMNKNAGDSALFDCLLRNLDEQTQSIHIRLSDEEANTYCQILESIDAKKKELIFRRDKLWDHTIEAFRRVGKFNSAIQFGLENIEYQIKAHGGISEQAAYAYYKQKHSYAYWGDAHTGYSYSKKALETIRLAKPNSISHCAICTFHAADYPFYEDAPSEETAFALLNESKSAIETTTEESSIFFDSKQFRQAMLYNYYAFLHNYYGHFEEALRYAKISYEQFQKCPIDGERNACATPLLNMAQAYSLLGERDIAVQTLNEAMERLRKYRNENSISYLRDAIKFEANVYINLREYDTALTILLNLKERFETLGYAESPLYSKLLEKIAQCRHYLT